jgi:carboxypeptidase family protein
MKSRALVVVAILLVIAASPVAGQKQPAQSQDDKPGSIRGRVTAADTSRPLRRVRVMIRSATVTGGTPPISANTNSLGQFEAKNVPPGAYFVSVNRAGYLTVQYGQRRPGERGVTVEVASGQTVNGIDFALPRGGVLAGRITDDLGEPFPGVRIDALAMQYQRGQRVPSPSGGATTDDLGQFRIAGLPPGKYYVVASSTETWKAEKNQTYGYASTYFPGGPSDMAQVITLGPSEQRTDLNMSLHVSRTARITGRVRRENGEPVAGANVSLAYSYPGVIMTAGMRSVRTAGDGSFEIKDVAEGVYMVGGGSAEQIVTVAGADIEGLLLVARTGSNVSGTLATEDGTPPPFPSSGVRVTLSAPFGKVLPTVYVNAVESDWSFKLMGLGGPFMFRVMGLPPDWTLGAVRLNQKDITDTPWDVPTGAKEISGLKVVVTQKIGRVSGMVADSSGRPTSSATIVVFSEDVDHWTPGSRFTRTTRPGADGRFSIRDLPAGTYRAVARDYIEEGQWEDRKFLEELRDDGVRFTLAEGASDVVTLRLPAAK